MRAGGRVAKEKVFKQLLTSYPPPSPPRRPPSGPENKHRYVLATQSVPLRNHMRAGVPALPVMHIKRGVTVLEPMSDVSVRRKAQVRLPGSATSRRHVAER